MGKKTIKLNEAQLREMVSETIQKVINEEQELGAGDELINEEVVNAMLEEGVTMENVGDIVENLRATSKMIDRWKWGIRLIPKVGKKIVMFNEILKRLLSEIDGIQSAFDRFRTMYRQQNLEPSMAAPEE